MHAPARRTPRSPLAAAALGVLTLAAAPAARAQGAPAGGAQGARATGSVTGTVTDAERRPVPGAQVTLVGTRLGALTDEDGRYRVGGVPAGTYTARVTRIGQRAKEVPGVTVAAGEAAALNVGLEGVATSLTNVVVTASRRVEKITDAPATVTSIGTRQLDATVGNIFAGALKEAKGVDFIQTGMTTVAINARGFNSSFNNRFLMVEDGRIAILPENGLPVGQFTPTPKVDLAALEVLVGPGSALYGPDASNGVLALRTKDPRQFPGLTVEASGGTRSYRDLQLRYAGVTGPLGSGALGGALGYKASGEYQGANDWSNYLRYNAGGTLVPDTTKAAVSEDALKTPIDWASRVARGSGALAYYLDNIGSRVELQGGLSRTDGVGQTNVGRNQLRGWTYNTLQLRVTSPHWYANAYRSQSRSGESFALNRYAGAQLAAANANLSADSLRMLSDWPSDGRMRAAELQGNYTFGMLRNTAAVFGGQYREDVVSSDRQWLTDRVTGRDVRNTIRGVYAQTTTPAARWLDVVLAGRYDKPSVYAAQWSPKAGLVFKPAQDQALRVTFNRAYKSPTILQTNFFIPDWTALVSIYGNTGGFTVRDAAGAVRATYGAVQPETNRTWEYGYKGVIAGKLYLDGTYYASDYRNFLSPLTIIANPYAPAAAGGPTYAYPTANPYGIPTNAQGRVVNAAGAAPITLVYYNLGDARLRGTDFGANYYASDRVELRGTLSTVGLSAVHNAGAGGAEATSLNSPGTKWTLGATARELGPWTAGFTLRTVNGYYFRSGVNSGVVPRFNTLDLTASYRLPRVQNALLNLSVSNLFSCTAQGLSYKTPAGGQPNSLINTQDRGCGVNRTHIEMVNMPAIGTMAFLGVRWQR